MLKNSSQFLLSEHHCEPNSLDFSLNIVKIKKVAWKTSCDADVSCNELYFARCRSMIFEIFFFGTAPRTRHNHLSYQRSFEQKQTSA